MKDVEDVELYGARIIDMALQIDENLIIADLHLGYENALISEGILIPKFQYKKIIKRLEEIFQKANSYHKIKRLIINGDLKHEFGRKSRQEYKETSELINFLRHYTGEIVLIRGNHDNFIKGMAESLNVKFCENFAVKNFFILHGDKIPKGFDDLAENKTVVIAHRHPCVGLRTSERTEKMKCFLKGKFGDKNLIVIPAFNFITEGTDVLQGNLLSQFLNTESIENSDVFGVENFETFHFGTVRDLLNLNV
ncbi:MAG: phosphoesterase [Candidatus Altiarchaeum hamiconexum]|uniref:Phosphoesterase n=1 Tax=Candidatus Altarchaeum hamiconexum TaxID=1803513 RepID=A0A8J8CFR7_9ARCH|nr:phosphoesterase [Candidatus Altarchaeum hamiconexum]OIQ04771.1 MAG: phosphoesterase [Candidatus Altarchaeum sp. CG2_30_32_3053]PIV28528.1 MAG: phosphoesterase [Candidatus Altarchaeum sp. CG03_land_8_20_14_0_80_32_618]PIZ32996.1 MAG: phosphoesterase [Candidatus Altarchaeum sp. CG_4_10_14_0_8_um_filter_32_851]NCN68542.1 phosphoesterase [Candidatus Altarchaeum hamiconexum]